MIYVVAVAAANVIVAKFGPSVSVVTAFLLVGLVITTRDRLHDAWMGRRLRLRMGALIASGGLLSYVIAVDAGRIALASCVAFVVSEAVDAVVYHARLDMPWLRRSNESNVASATVDSVLFPLLAFGAFLPWIIAGQFVAKVAGGFIWSLLMRRRTAVLACAVFAVASPLSAQVVSIGPATVSTEFGTDMAAELFVAAPPVVTIRPNIVASWSDGARPALIPKLSSLVIRSGPSFVSAEIGAALLPFRDYRPEFIVGAFLSAPLPLQRTALAVAVSAEPWNGWGWTLVTKIDVNLWFRR